MKKSQKSSMTFLLLLMILLYALISRLTYLLSYLKNDPFSKSLILDSFRYDQWAQSIAKGNLFEPAAFYQAPIYPYFIGSIYGLIGRFLPMIYVIQMIIGLASLFLLFLLAKRYFSEKVALISSFLFSMYGGTIFLESKLLPETIAIFMNLLFLYTLSFFDLQEKKGVRLSKSFVIWLAGLFLGLCCLIRPNMLLMLPLIGLWIIMYRKREGLSHTQEKIKIHKKIFYVGLFFLGTFLSISPVTLRNYLVSGEPVLISLNGGITFAQGNNPYATGIFTPLPGFSGDINRQKMEERYFARSQEQRDLSDAEVSKFWFKKGLFFIREEPISWFNLEIKKLFYFFDNYEHSLEYSYAIERPYLTYLSILPFGLIVSLAVLGIFASFPWGRKSPLILYLFAHLLTVLIFYMSSRYRLPSIPVFSLFSGYGLLYMIEALRRKDWLKGLAYIGIILMVSIISFLKWGDVYLREEASAYGNLGTAFNAAGMYQEAMTSFQKQRDLDRESAYALFNIGVILSKMGKEGEAIGYYEKAIQMNPSLSEAYNNLGVIFVSWGECMKAEFFFLKAIETKPFFPNPYINLITCYLMKGEIEKIMRIKGLADLNGVAIPQNLERDIQDRVVEESFP